MNARVYRVARTKQRRNAGVWHWPVWARDGRVSACTGWPLSEDTSKHAVSIDIVDRCRGNGCRQQWDQWLRDTVRACLLEEATPR